MINVVFITVFEYLEVCVDRNFSKMREDEKRNTPSIFFADFSINLLFYTFVNLNWYKIIAVWPIEHYHNANVMT